MHNYFPHDYNMPLALCHNYFPHYYNYLPYYYDMPSALIQNYFPPFYIDASTFHTTTTCLWHYVK